MKYLLIISVFWGLGVFAASPDEELRNFDGLFISEQYQFRQYIAALPVERVSWNEAVSFCKELTEPRA